MRKDKPLAGLGRSHETMPATDGLMVSFEGARILSDDIGPPMEVKGGKLVEMEILNYQSGVGCHALVIIPLPCIRALG